tara:strand:+ start:299 stop:565 length:267 start_codon:yes stop_codon:yes gene_type:complete
VLKSKKKTSNSNILKIERKIIASISKILGVKNEVLVKKNDFRKFKEWDSLKHLEIITQLTKIAGKKIDSNRNLSEVTNLKKILSIIKK